MAAKKKPKARTATKKKAVAKAAKKPAKKSKPAKAKAPARKAAKAVKAGASKKKKAPAKKKKQGASAPKSAKRFASTRAAPQQVGEGDYAASRAFLKDQAGFVQKNKAKIPALGKQARAALEGSEGPSLLAAEAEARSHSKGSPSED